MNAPVLLVVDDDEDNRYTLTHRLRREGYHELREAVDGVEALERVAAEPIDLVLLDMMMPRLDGMGVLARLKAEPAWCHVPVIVISAATDLERVARAIELGAEDYLAKPFDRVILRARIGAALERKRLRDVERHHLAAVEAERRRADALLHVLLPRLAVAELKAKDRLEPRRFEHVAVLFADIVGFTRWCEAESPERVVGALDALVRAFEDLMAPFGLEKIHSTGDAFIATANLLEPHADPTGACLACARAMAAVAAAVPPGFALRIGIHAGGLVAGLIGAQKFRFDILGDTVNVAARLSQLGAEPAIYLTGVAAALTGRMPLEPLGALPLKGRGALEVFRAPGPG